MVSEDPSTKAKAITEFIKNVGIPGALAFVLLAMMGWQFHVANQMQAQTLTVIEKHTAAVEVNTAAIESLRDEMRRNR